MAPPMPRDWPDEGASWLAGGRKLRGARHCAQPPGWGPSGVWLLRAEGCGWDHPAWGDGACWGGPTDPALLGERGLRLLRLAPLSLALRRLRLPPLSLALRRLRLPPLSLRLLRCLVPATIVSLAAGGRHRLCC